MNAMPILVSLSSGNFLKIMTITLIVAAMPFKSHAREFCIKGEGQGHVFCEEIVKALNRTEPTMGRLPCISEVLFKMPGVSDPPWEKLDLAQHEQLATNIWLISQKGFYGFFDEPSQPVPDYWPKPDVIARYPDYLKKSHAELFAFRSSILPDKVFVTLRIPSFRCGWPIEPRGEDSMSAWVSSDLKQIERIVATPLISRPLLYRNRLYFSVINPDTGMVLSRVTPSGVPQPVCEIYFNSSDTHNCKGQRK